MSSSFDTMQRALESLDGDSSVKAGLRFCISAIHDFDHSIEGALNFKLGKQARLLEDALAEARRQIEESET
jgi:hypothetical protein